MAIFGSLKAAVNKVFGGSTKTFKPHVRKEAEAKVQVTGQSARRKALLQRRVAAGTSDEVYPNKKNIDLGESPYVQDFLDGFLFSRFASSCVYAVAYDRTKNHLYVQYLGGKGKKRGGPGRWFKYYPVSIAEAKTIYNAASKGVWSWDHLRLRGTVSGTKKNFTRDESPPGYLPLGRQKSNILQSP